MTPIGRFAPTPSGDLHFGSLIGALGSYLSVKSQQGQWKLRIDDIDRPRVQAGSIQHILKTLERFGLLWDGPVVYQSQRIEAYQDGFEQLKRKGLVYPCRCTRKEILAEAKLGLDGPIYPGTCRLSAAEDERSFRVRTESEKLTWMDRHFGRQSMNLESEVGDFILWRVDGVPSYHLATVVDESLDGITEVVRGRDLLTSTFRQIYLQQKLGYPSPSYLHLPLVINQRGKKLSKQTKAPSLEHSPVVPTLSRGLEFLGLSLPLALEANSPEEVLQWGVDHWNERDVPSQDQLALLGPEAQD